MKEKQISTSLWTRFLDPIDPKNSDPFDIFKDSISYQLELLTIKIQDELIANNSNYAIKEARKMAICLLMERLLIIQNEHAEQSLNAMAISLFADLPGLKDFRYELLSNSKENFKPKKWYQKIFTKNTIQNHE